MAEDGLHTASGCDAFTRGVDRTILRACGSARLARCPGYPPLPPALPLVLVFLLLLSLLTLRAFPRRPPCFIFLSPCSHPISSSAAAATASPPAPLQFSLSPSFS
eukprot:5580239-Pleurochrysis_carterae.AAC.1